MTVKFFYNGMKVDGVLYRAYYSTGPYNEASKLPVGTITLYAKDYSADFPEIEGSTIENDSDIQTDYFETDRMRILPDSPFHAAAKAAFEAAQEKSKERHQRKYGTVA